MRRLALLLLLATPLSAQVLQNPSFESPVAFVGANGIGSWSYGSIPGWNVSSYYNAGVWATNFSGQDGKQIAWIDAGSISQDAGPALSGTAYTLTVAIGSRPDANTAGTAVLTLGSCSTSVNVTAIPKGTFQDFALACPNPGELLVTLGLGPNSSSEIFDNVRLVAVNPAPPPQYQQTTFKVQLVGCTKCDGTDYEALTSAGIYQGSTFSLTQDGQNVCGATLNTQAQASCTGPVNVAPAIINLSYLVTSPANTALAAQTAQFPSILAGGATTGNVVLIIGFDTTTMMPRSVQLYTQ